MKLSKGLIALLVIAGVLVIIGLWAKSSYNKMVRMEEGVTSAWSNVETQYQRRADLIDTIL